MAMQHQEVPTGGQGRGLGPAAGGFGLQAEAARASSACDDFPLFRRPVEAEVEVEGAAATEVVTLWQGSVVGVKHFPHAATFGRARPITTRQETALAGACMVAGGVVLGPALGGLVRRALGRGVVPTERSFTLGEDPRSDVPLVPEALGGATRFSLVDVDERGSRINLVPAMTGDVLLADGTRREIDEVAGGARSFELPDGAVARLEIGDLTFHVSSVPPGRLPAAPYDTDWTAMAYTGFSFLAHATFMLLVYLVPPDPRSLMFDNLEDGNRFVRYLVAPPEVAQQPTEDWLVSQPTEPQGGTGERHADAEGSMGDRNAPDTRRHYGIQGPRDNPDPHMARDRARELAATSGILAVLQSAAPTSPFGRETALGNDPENALGAMMGNELGTSFGLGGLGVQGTGRGGGGDGRGGIGLGHLGKIGRGGGPGRGQGYGPGAGLPLRSRPAGQGPTVREGTVSVGGALSPETIRRYIRRQLPQIRGCYEEGLRSRPDLQGRVAVRFVINSTGAVSGASIADSTMGHPAVDACVVRAVERIAFPAPENGGAVVVTYPFVFQSID